MSFKRRFWVWAVLCLPLVSGWDAPGARAPWGRWQSQPEVWYQSEEGRQIADNILTWQSPQGSWPKNTDTARRPFEGQTRPSRGTFDNQGTKNELEFLARAFRATGDVRYKDAFLKGLDDLLEAQYDNGGWPQSHPPGIGYARHITFNDGTMVWIMRLLRDVGSSSEYAFVDDERRASASDRFDRGVACILKCQVIVEGKKTVWCAQHDEEHFSPRSARSYELESLSGSESAGVLRLLMSLENPNSEVREAIRAGAEWFEEVKLSGIRQVRVNGDKRVVSDPEAPPLWARFYEIGTNRPFFCGRDGVKKYRLEEIEAERRNGYAWYVDSGEDVAREYEKWKKKHP